MENYPRRKYTVPSDLRITIGERLQQLRQKTQKENPDITNQEKFADYLGIGTTGNGRQKRISRLEKGYDSITPEELIAYSNKCGVSTDWILKGTEFESPIIATNQQEPTYYDLLEAVFRLQKLAGMRAHSIHSKESPSKTVFALDCTFPTALEREMIKQGQFLPIIMTNVFNYLSKYDFISTDADQIMIELIEAWKSHVLLEAKCYSLSGKQVATPPSKDYFVSLWEELVSKHQELNRSSPYSSQKFLSPKELEKQFEEINPKQKNDPLKP